MKVTMKSDGTLFIEAETELEQYALAQWAGENMKPGQVTKNLMLSWASRGPGVTYNPQHGPKPCMVCGGNHGGLRCPKLTPSAGSPVHSMTCPRRDNYAAPCTCGAEIRTYLAGNLQP